MVTDPAQISAIKRTWEIARDIQVKHPEVANRYRGGDSHRLISTDFHFPSEYRVNGNMAMHGVEVAIRGHDAHFGVSALPGLIEPDELDEISKTHHQVTGRKNGHATLRGRKGIHALTYDDRRRLGESSRDQRKGIFGLNDQQNRLKDRNSAIARGQTPWAEREELYGLIGGVYCHVATRLSEKEYLMILYEGADKSKPGYGNTIKNELNGIYHGGEEVRTLEGVCTKIRRILKKRN